MSLQDPSQRSMHPTAQSGHLAASLQARQVRRAAARRRTRHGIIGKIGTVAIIALLVIAALPVVEAQSRDWTNHGRDAMQQARATGESLKTPLKIAWTKNHGEEISGSPVIADSTVIVATHGGTVAAYDTKSSEKLWSIKLSAGVRGSPAIDNDRVYVATYNETGSTVTGRLYELDLNTGRQTSSVDLKSGSWAGPVIQAGRLFIGLENGNLQHYATADIKTLVWEFSTALNDAGGKANASFPAKAIRVTPSVEDNVVYFGATNKIFYAVDANNGQEIWIENLISNTIYSAATVDGTYTSGNVDGVVYVGGYDGKFYAFETEKASSAGACQTSRGKDQPFTHHCSAYKVWVYEAGSPIHTSPALANGHLYIGDNNGKVHAVKQAAHSNTIAADWTAETGGAIKASPVVIGKSVIVGSQSGKLHVFTEDAEGGLANSWSMTLSAPIEASPAIAEGMVFVAAKDGVLHALIDADTEAPELKNAPEGAANLRIAEVKLTPRTMTEGQALTFDVTVANDGAADSGQFKLQFEVDGEMREEAVLEVPAGETVVHAFKFLISPAQADVKFIADSGEAVAESDEADNTHSLHLVSGQDPTGGGGDEGEPIVIENNTGETTEEDVPAPGLALVGMMTVALALLVGRRRH